MTKFSSDSELTVGASRACASETTFDTILFSAWLHHVPHDQFDRFWGTVERLLAPGGVVVFDFLDASVPSPGRVEI